MVKIVLSILFCHFILFAVAQQEQGFIVKGNDLYKKGEFDAAANQYQKATQLNRQSVKAYYNLGNALFKSGKNDEAEEVFEMAASKTKDPLEKSKAYYNKGVACTKQKKITESIVAYKQSLRLNSNDQQARENLQLALNELRKQQQQQKPKDNQKQQQEKPDQDKQQQEKNNSRLNKEQVEDMLNALRQDEKKLQQNIQKKNNQPGNNAKDW